MTGPIKSPRTRGHKRKAVAQLNESGDSDQEIVFNIVPHSELKIPKKIPFSQDKNAFFTFSKVQKHIF